MDWNAYNDKKIIAAGKIYYILFIWWLLKNQWFNFKITWAESQIVIQAFRYFFPKCNVLFYFDKIEPRFQRSRWTWFNYFFNEKSGFWLTPSILLSFQYNGCGQSIYCQINETTSIHSTNSNWMRLHTHTKINWCNRIHFSESILLYSMYL